jgi:hypothetical protein
VKKILLQIRYYHPQFLWILFGVASKNFRTKSYNKINTIFISLREIVNWEENLSSQFFIIIKKRRKEREYVGTTLLAC